jgi:hypothetical protein
MQFSKTDLKRRRCQIIADIIFQIFEEKLGMHTRVPELLIPDDWALIGTSSSTSKYREHVVPLAYLRDESFKIFNNAEDPKLVKSQVEQFWFDYYLIVYLTKEEADHLNKKYKTSMPDGWKIGDDAKERLSLMGIKLVN